MTRSVVGVIVTYRPDGVQLAELLRVVRPQLAHLVIVDNTWGGFPCERSASAELIEIGRNRGLAAAQNVGIRRALELGAQFVLLLDQDSVPSGSMVDELVAAHDRLVQRGVPVAAVGPRLIDARTEASQPVVQADTLRMRLAWFEKGTEVLETEFLVASGSLLSRSALERIGLMDETLFIDQIDVEWELRARAQGLKLFAVGPAVMRHNLGTGDRRIWFLRFHQVPVHAPLRNYYLFRNSFDIFFKRPAPLVWRIDRIKALVIMGFGYVTQVEPRWLRLRMIARGLWHALIGRRGQLGL
jgi:rhamnosyltransferase